MSIHRKDQSFTLIELLIVIAIIGILAALIIISLNTVLPKARDATRKAELSEVQKAITTYYVNNGAYPISYSNGGTSQGGCLSTPLWDCWGQPNWTCTSYPHSLECVLANAGYIASMPQDPAFNDDGGACALGDTGTYAYYYWSNGTNYVLATHLNSISASDPNYYHSISTGCSGFANYALQQ